jgi:hypothetical protein
MTRRNGRMEFNSAGFILTPQEKRKVSNIISNAMVRTTPLVRDELYGSNTATEDLWAMIRERIHNALLKYRQSIARRVSCRKPCGLV